MPIFLFVRMARCKVHEEAIRLVKDHGQEAVAVVRSALVESQAPDVFSNTYHWRVLHEVERLLGISRQADTAKR